MGAEQLAQVKTKVDILVVAGIFGDETDLSPQLRLELGFV